MVHCEAFDWDASHGGWVDGFIMQLGLFSLTAQSFVQFLEPWGFAPTTCLVFSVSFIIPHAEFSLRSFIRFLITHHEKNYS